MLSKTGKDREIVPGALFKLTLEVQSLLPLVFVGGGVVVCVAVVVFMFFVLLLFRCCCCCLLLLLFSLSLLLLLFVFLLLLIFLSSPIGGASISYFKNFCPASAYSSAYASACHLVFPNDNS